MKAHDAFLDRQFIRFPAGHAEPAGGLFRQSGNPHALGTFGDTRITHAGIRKLYYDDVTWKGLQQLSNRSTPGICSHIRFTVQLS
jgi:hypothetical protein